MRRHPSLLAQVIAVLSRRTPAFQPARGQPRTFSGTLILALRPHHANTTHQQTNTSGQLQPESMAPATDLDKAQTDNTQPIGQDSSGLPVLSSALKPHSDLRGANLARANLTGANLTEADLRGVDLTTANLTGANLTRAHLAGANLARANLTGADLIETNLTGADLTGAHLFGADLTEANLIETNLTGADLTGTNLTGANLTEADLRGVDLTTANLTGANLTRAHLAGVDLTGANLIETNLTGADLTGTNLARTRLTFVKLVDVGPARFADAVVDALAGARWSSTTIWPSQQAADAVAQGSRLLEDGHHEVVGDGRDRDRDHQYVSS
ncbi:uncharacterized protein YjbI with pentapeptide repeats [Kibdelosporangium banguiense]|uniref:Uncharacterized protein YjbI with pentapeptide repeats n=1 Tax=Kibdelosporangium banguiense TaxID=1365924 RepID=A0ABS4TAV6_9PSEU|nr:pentapeptide repeat-containing protein [Kibdelosporangium banguiense]MBP2321538.1 uncharacterized protein YjbI with pentapeptide repeats [Kibdelosporangium banguiense]